MSDDLDKARLAVLPLLVKSVEESLDELEHSWDAAPADKVARARLSALLHKLKGGAGLLEVHWLYDLFLQLEEAAHHLSNGARWSLADSASFTRAVARLRTWVARLP